jgi:hypothetical protein
MVSLLDVPQKVQADHCWKKSDATGSCLQPRYCNLKFGIIRLIAAALGGSFFSQLVAAQ